MNNRRQNEKRAVAVHIEELILHGFPMRDRDQIARAVESELMRLLGQGEMPQAFSRGGMIPKIDGGTFRMKRDATPQVIGEQIAQNIYGGFKR